MIGHMLNDLAKAIRRWTKKKDEIKVAEQLLRFTMPKAVHFGLMCGTCSRARERSLAPSLRRQGAPEPAPLRDELHLLGKPNLRPP